MITPILQTILLLFIYIEKSLVTFSMLICLLLFFQASDDAQGGRAQRLDRYG